MIAPDVIASLRPALLLHARALKLSEADAEDLVQDTLMILADRDPRHLLAYAKQILVSLLIRRGEAARKEAAAVELVAEGLVRL